MASVLHTGLSNAAYVTLLDTLGGANADPTAGALQKITESVLTLVSIALIPVITAAVVESVVNARLALALGKLKEPISDHVIVAGLGNVGTRVIRQLHDLGIPVVAIDKSENARGIPVARRLDIPYIVGDVSREETLRSASVQTCRALLVLSTDDMTNLEAALQGRNLKDDLRVVLRLFDGDFADRVQRVFGIPASRSVSYLAAPAFALAMLEREAAGCCWSPRCRWPPVRCWTDSRCRPRTRPARRASSRSRRTTGVPPSGHPRSVRWWRRTACWWWPPGPASVGCSRARLRPAAAPARYPRSDAASHYTFRR